MRVLFLAPLKPPDDPVPSGDRTMARLFARLLGRLGYEVELATRLRAHVPVPTPERWAGLTAAAAAETARLLAAERGRTPPACVFTYHNYYKAPDLVGPALAAALGVPYVIAEAARKPSRAQGAFAEGHHLADAAIARARLLLLLTARDREMLEPVAPPGQRLVDLKPFIDPGDWPGAGAPAATGEGAPRLVTVAMMRRGDKLASYRQLGTALAQVAHPDWRLDVVGDGPAREEVAAILAPFGDRVRLLGEMSDRAALGSLLRAARLFVWPGVNEAFGAVFLEAAAHGLPSVAAAYGGIPEVVQHGVTGLLTPEGDTGALAGAIDRLLADETTRATMAAAAAGFVARERSLEAAASIVAAAFAATGIPRPDQGRGKALDLGNDAA
ncbi:glycosyltransferase family 4 protein [Ancylobacter terrae]|uniref:glycosyltransferase family 4 protein n=1 Tax=Ancylobacter sp. sgz301288 TaxID=3342077 RepID=UPI0038588FE7